MTDSKKTPDQTMIFNGINGATGAYDLQPQTPQDIASIARGVPIDPAHRQDIAIRRDLDASREDHYGLREGLDPKDLSQAGWGVIFPQDLTPSELAGLKEALRPLLEHRQEQAARIKEHYYKECLGDKGYLPRQSKGEFLAVHGRGAGPADPEKLPYYLLIVGDPQTVPYSFQYQLDVQYAVGRIHFDRLEDYYRYAVSVVEAEKRAYSLPRQAVFFGAANPDDRATQLSAEHLVTPLADYLSENHPDWQIQANLRDMALKANLHKIMTAEQAPAFLFTASHGMSFPNGDTRQFPHQGALLCQDWPGPQEHKGRIPEDYYFSADDLSDDGNVLGTLAFFFACYGAGTPMMDDFYRKAYVERKAIAPHAFLSRLPQRMLTHPKGGALAVVGHVERAWGYSFFWQGVGKELVTFESTLTRLMEGHPLGSALEYFNSRYAELASDLTSELDETSEELQNAVKIAGLWTASNDARNYLVLGDPAVRLQIGETPNTQPARTEIIELLDHEAELQAGTVQQEGAPGTAPAAETPQTTGLTTQTVSISPTLSGTEADYGFRESVQTLGVGIGGGIQRLVDKLGDYLSNALDDAASLEVKTYVSQDMSEVKYVSGQFSGASLRALTRIKIDGDTDICVPEVDGEIDTDLWQIHMDMVRQAQESRAELLKTVVSAVSGLAGFLKGG
jgi:hypothetical protein